MLSSFNLKNQFNAVKRVHFNETPSVFLERDKVVRANLILD